VKIMKTIIVSGGTFGLGQSITVELAQRGYHVVAFGLMQPQVSSTAQGADSLRAELAACRCSADILEADVADALAVERVVEHAMLRHGAIHGLVNNAAISPKDEVGGRLGAIDTPFDLWQRVFNVNFFAPVALARGLMGELSEARGCVVNVTSIAGSRVHPFAGSAYATSKAALAALTREMAHDFGPRGIRVNAIAPGEIDTAILSPGTEQIVEEQIPMRRLGTPDEVADVIHFLCEKGASYVSGAEIQINGGQHV